jgi:hypothetical protein
MEETRYIDTILLELKNKLLELKNKLKEFDGHPKLALLEIHSSVIKTIIMELKHNKLELEHNKLELEHNKAVIDLMSNVINEINETKQFREKIDNLNAKIAELIIEKEKIKYEEFEKELKQKQIDQEIYCKQRNDQINNQINKLLNGDVDPISFDDDVL